MSHPPRPGDEGDDAAARYGTPDPYAIPDPSARDAEGGYGVPDVPDGPGSSYGSPPPLPPTSPQGGYGGPQPFAGQDPYGQGSYGQGSYGQGTFSQGPYSAPGPYARGPVGFPPPNHLVWAILTTFLCCTPFGVVAIVFGSQVSSKWASGDFEGARRASANARTWSIVTAVCGVVFWLFAIVSGVTGS